MVELHSIKSGKKASKGRMLHNGEGKKNPPQTRKLIIIIILLLAYYATCAARFTAIQRATCSHKEHTHTCNFGRVVRNGRDHKEP